MRPKVVLAILLMGAAVLVIAIMLSNVFHPQPVIAPAQVAIAPSNPAPAAPAPEPVDEVAPVPITVTNHDTNAMAGQKVDREEYVRNRHEELLDLARDGSPAAYQQILGELKNPDRAIRKAALDALEQANDRSFVPQMQQIADQTDDPDDKQAIQDAIDFINLPSLTEVLQQQKAQKMASGNQPQSQTPRPSPPHPVRPHPPKPNQ